MAIGIFNGKDVTRTTETRPGHVMLAEGVRKWMSDTLRTRPKAQDWNAIIAQFREAADALMVADEETDTDFVLRDSILSAVKDLSTGPIATVASAATANIGVVRNSRIDITGSAAISSFGATPNKIRLVRTTGSPSITLPSGQSYQASPGDAFLAHSNNAGVWTILAYWPSGDQLFGLPRPTLAASATVDIGAQQAFAIEISGTSSISSLGNKPNQIKLLRVTGLPTFVHSPGGAGIAVPGGVDYVADAGDHVLAFSDNTGKYSIAIFRVDQSTSAFSGDAADLFGQLGAARLPWALRQLHSLTQAPNKIAYYSDLADTDGYVALLTDLSVYARGFLATVNAAAARAYLGVGAAGSTFADITGVIGNNQLPGPLKVIAPLLPGNDSLAFYQVLGVGGGGSVLSAGLTSFTGFARDLLAAVDDAAARTILGVAGGVDGDAATLNGQAGPFYRNANNMNAGQLSAARLPWALRSLHPLAQAANKLAYYSDLATEDGYTAALTDFTAFARTLLAQTTAASARSVLGVGSGGTTNAGDLTSGTLPAARLPWALRSLHPLAQGPNKLAYYTDLATDDGYTAALTELTAFARNLLAQTSAAEARSLLGVSSGGTNNASDLTTGTLPSGRLPSILALMYGLLPEDNNFVYYTNISGTTVANRGIVTSFARSVLAQTTAASMRSQLGLGALATASGGSGSGLDSDLLDGQHGAYYQNAANLNAGIVPVARLPNPLAALYAISPNADSIMYYSGIANAFGFTPQFTNLTSYSRGLFGQTNASSWRSALGISDSASITYTADQNMSPLPTLAGTSSSGSGTYSAQTGRYSRIGNRVMFNIRLVWSSHSGTGNMQVNGLPFSANGTHQLAVGGSNLLAVPQGYISTGSNQITIRTAGGADFAMEGAGELRISGQYEIG